MAIRRPGHFAALFVLLAICCTGPFTAAQEGAPVAGKVVAKSTAAGIQGVVVLISELQLADETDSQGRFRFDRVLPGTYNVVLTLGGDTSIQPLVVPARRHHRRRVRGGVDLRRGERRGRHAGHEGGGCAGRRDLHQ